MREGGLTFDDMNEREKANWLCAEQIVQAQTKVLVRINMIFKTDISRV